MQGIRSNSARGPLSHGGGFGSGAFVLTLFVGTGDDGSGFQSLLDEVLTAAGRTLLRNRLVGGGELALGVVGAAVESVALAGALLHQFAGFAQRALHADKVLLHILALGVAAAGGEFAVAAVAEHHIPAALGTGFVEGNVGHLAALVEAARGLALGIAGAGHELPEAAALKHHGTAAVLAVLLLRSFLHIGRVQVRQVNGIFLGEGAGVGIVLVVGAAGVEGTVPAPLDDQGGAATLALFFRRLLHTLNVFHVLFSVFEILLEFFVELAQGVGPLLLAFLNLVELFFEAGGVLRVENVLEIFDEQVSDDQAYFGGHKFAAHLLHVLPFLDGAQDGGVGGRTADTALFQFLDQRSFVVARGRLGEVLLGLELAQREGLACFQRRQLVLERLVFLVFAFLGFLVDLEEAVELEHG